MTSRRATRRIGIALIAVYALVLQSLVGVHAGASRATGWPLEIAGGSLCADHNAASLPTDNSRPDAGGAADCCLPGCPMFAPVLATPPLVFSNFALLRHETAILPAVSADIPSSHGTGRPGNPRAPPMTA